MRHIPPKVKTLRSVAVCTVTEWLEHRASSKGAAMAITSTRMGAMENMV